MILYQAVIVPLLLLFVFGYIALRPATGRGLGMALFDAAVIIAAIALSIAAGWWVSGLEPAAEGSIWSTVMTTVSTFHVFPAVLLLGGYLRGRIFRTR